MSKYGGGINTGDGGGGITGDHPALLDPASLDDLADFLEPTYRPEFSHPSLASTIYVGDWSSDSGGVGSDTTGDGTLAEPFATIQKAVQLIGAANPSAVSILLAGGASEAARATHLMPGLVSQYNWIDIVGLERDAETATQTGAAVQSDEEALIIDVTGITSGGAIIDDLQGRLIEWTSGPASGDRGWIYRNDVTGTTAPGVTRLSVTQDDVSGLNIPATGNTLKILELTSELQITEFFSVVEGSVQHNLRSLVMADTGTGTFVYFPAGTDKIGCTNVRFEIGRVQVGRNGAIEFFTCYLANLGNANRGMLAVRRGGDCLILRGSVIDGDLRATADANRHLELSNTAKISYDGNSVFLGLNTKGVQMDGADCASQDSITSRHSWTFDDCDAGVVINSTTTGLSGWYQLPNLHGEVASTYAVTATDCACVRLGATSSLRTAGGAGTTNAVSADGGASAVAQAPDTTYMSGGAPAPVGFAFVGSGITGPGSTVDRGRVVWDSTGGDTLADTGLRDYGASATDPVAPAPADGDTYRNTAIDQQMYYDGTRAKWLGDSAQIAFGRAGNVGSGAYYRGIDRRSFSSTNGRAARHNGTVVAIEYTRNDSDAATFEAVADGSTIATLASSATSGSSSALDGDFAAGQVLAARNQAGGNTTSQTMGWITIRWRA